MPLWSAPASAQGDVATVLASPYRRVYQLAHGLASGQPTTYDVVPWSCDPNSSPAALGFVPAALGRESVIVHGVLEVA